MNSRRRGACGRHRLRPVLGGLLLLTAACAAPPLPMEEARASVSLSEPARFYAAGDPIELDLSVYNADQQPIACDEGLWRGERFQLTGGGGEVAAAPQPAGPQPEVLAPGQRVSHPVDLGTMFPSLQEPGDYALTVVFPSYRSNSVAIKVIPAYDPSRQYLADVETDLGNFTLRFFPDVAPRHVRNFIDLARSGFYDNVIVHRIMPGIMFQTGDPTSSGRGGPGWTLRAEFNHRPHKRGTLSMARQADNPDSAGSQWFVCLDRIPEWDGQYTVFGEVTAGMGTVDAIGRSKVRNEIPTTEIKLRRVTIRAAAAAPEEQGEPAGAAGPVR